MVGWILDGKVSFKGTRILDGKLVGLVGWIVDGKVVVGALRRWSASGCSAPAVQ